MNTFFNPLLTNPLTDKCHYHLENHNTWYESGYLFEGIGSIG